MILVDTREKNTHIIDALTTYNIKWKRQKLNSGDYAAVIPKNEALGIKEDIYTTIAIERKNSLEEIGTNLSAHRARFKREFARKECNIIIMIEDASYKDIILKNYKNQIHPKSFLASLHSISAEFNVPFVFMDSQISPLYVYNTMYYDLRNQLKQI